MKRARTADSKGRPAKKFKRRSIVNPPQRKFNRVEKKNFDFISTVTVVAAQTTAVITSIFIPDQGTSPTDHVGRRVNVKSLAWKWQGSMAATSAGASPLRMVILFDKQPNAALATATTMFNQDNISTFTQLANSQRFIVLADKIIPSVGTGGPQGWSRKGFIKLNLQTEFNEANGGTVADITTGNYIVVFWQNGNIITASPTNVFTSRFRFSDN